MDTLPPDLCECIVARLGYTCGQTMGAVNREFRAHWRTVKRGYRARRALDIFRDLDPRYDFGAGPTLSDRMKRATLIESSHRVEFSTPTIEAFRDAMGAPVKALFSAMGLCLGRSVVAGGAIVDWLRGSDVKDLDVYALGATAAEVRAEAMRLIAIVVEWNAARGFGIRIRANRSVITVRGVVEIQVMLCSPGMDAEKLVSDFDIPPCQTFYDGDSVYMTPKCYFSWVDAGYDVRELYSQRACFRRACKYAKRKGFSCFMEIDDPGAWAVIAKRGVDGLDRLFLPSERPFVYNSSAYVNLSVSECIAHVRKIPETDMVFFHAPRVSGTASEILARMVK